MRCLWVQLVTVPAGGRGIGRDGLNGRPRGLVEGPVNSASARCANAPSGSQSRGGAPAGAAHPQGCAPAPPSMARDLSVWRRVGAPLPFGGNGKKDEGWPGTRFLRAAQRWLRGLFDINRVEPRKERPGTAPPSPLWGGSRAKRAGWGSKWSAARTQRISTPPPSRPLRGRPSTRGRVKERPCGLATNIQRDDCLM